MEENNEIPTELGIEKIIEDIHDNKCILLLGPLMLAEYNGDINPLYRIFCDRLVKELEPANIVVQPEAKSNPYYILTKYNSFVGGRTNLEKKIKGFSDVFLKGSSAAYDSLSKLPFNTIINFGHDRMMQNALNKNGYEFSDKYYNYRATNKQQIEGLDDKLQLVYNLLGSVNDFNSQVLTEEDQLLFMKKIVSENTTVPDNVLSRLKEYPGENKSYIFLGFNFNEWPFRFLLDVLQLPKTKRSASPNMPGQTIALMTKEFYEERFGLNFIDLGPEAFAEKLVALYTDKYKSDSHKVGFISYHDEDANIFSQFVKHLDNSKLGKRIKFWNKGQIVAGDNKENVLHNHLQEATVFIPLLSNSYLSDNQLTAQVRFMLSKQDTLIFPILVSGCDYQTAFEDIVFRSSLILPNGEDKFLLNALEDNLPHDVFLNIIKKINSKIR